jgi:predicted dehydrogenase
VRQAQPTLGERVAVLGLGLIGQLTVQLLAANGCRVLGFDPNPARAKLATDHGAEVGVSADLEAAAERFTRGDGLDAVIVAASTPSSGPLEQAGEISRLRGRVVVVGLVGMEVPRSLYYKKELDLRMSMSYGPGRYDPNFEERGFDYPIAHVRWSEQRNLEAILELLAARRVAFAPLVTHRYSIDQALAAYDLITKGAEPFLGVVLDYGADAAEAKAPAPQLALREGARKQGALGVGFVGAGGFGQSVLLPALKAAGDNEPIAIASAGGATARRVGEQYGFRVATADAALVIAHPDVDAVFVLTRHDLHAPLVVRALEAGKHVFCEKPLALTRDELAAVERARAASKGDVMVGFNRRFAPLVQRIAAHFAGRSAPLVMHYRVNAGFLPPEHWVHDPVEGGGRILGEGCHFIDLLHFLAGAPPVRVYGESIGGGSRFRGDDNVAITIRFADGSVGTLTYTASGDSTLGKEYLEVYGEGGVAILDDFRTLVLARNRKQERVKAANQDKGFETELRRFVAAARSGGEMPIPFDQLLASSRATIAATESLQRGTPVDVQDAAAQS